MSYCSPTMATMDWLLNAISDESSTTQNQNSSLITSVIVQTNEATLRTNVSTDISAIDEPSTPHGQSSSSTSSVIIEPHETSSEIEILTDINIDSQGQSVNTAEPTLISINHIDFDLIIKWKIRGIVIYKYDVRRFNNDRGEGEIFSFDIQDNTGEITVTSFNLSAQALRHRININKTYEISGLSIRTANANYKTLPNRLQLISTTQTIVNEITAMPIAPLPYNLLNLKDLDGTDINSIVDIRCTVIRDYGMCTGASNDRTWIKRELHVLEGSHQCRLTLWNKQAKINNDSLVRRTIKCKYLKVKWYNDVAKHTCLSDDISIDPNRDSIRDLISLLSPHINHLRVNCSQCFILNDEISIADVAYLIVCNKKKEWSLCVDLNVYSKNQQFRLYDSSKSGLNNPLTTTLDYPFEQSKSYSYFDILHKSLITNINNINVPLLKLKNNHLFTTQPLPLNHELNCNDMKSLCNSLQEDCSRIFQYRGSNLISFYKKEKKILSKHQTQQTPRLFDTVFDNYIPFINSIITQGEKYIGRIQSYAQGSRNTNKLFFNIAGEYRFCPKKGTHHKRNSTAIIVDISNDTYAIRCKDPECDNTFLTWHHIYKI
ncbi:unnamed protein product [Rotaria sp. Silwood1]|nr:unnamed protein product [Rotaria sp. Silwood1]CAF4590602.1 unnamed protein product [Rotaria sp. Silwood1]